MACSRGLLTSRRSGLYLFNVTVSDGDGGTAGQSVNVTINDIAPLPLAARSDGSSIVLMLSETVTSSNAGPNGFSVASQGNPVEVESISGNSTDSLTPHAQRGRIKGCHTGLRSGHRRRGR